MFLSREDWLNALDLEKKKYSKDVLEYNQGVSEVSEVKWSKNGQKRRGILKNAYLKQISDQITPLGVICSLAVLF